MTLVACRLTAKNRDQLRNPTLRNQVRANFTFSCLCQVYLVDYGLAYRYVFDDGRRTEYKEDPRRVHDGTIEFTSRDAHLGVRKRIFITSDNKYLMAVT